LPSYDTDTDHAKGYTTFSSAQKARTVIALSYISSVLDVSFTEKTTASGLNTLSFASNNQTGSGGYAQYPSSSFSGSDLFLNIADYNTTLADGTYGTYTLMHELGHALGLKHPFDEKDAAGNVEVPPYLQGSEDSTTWTYISYNYSSSEYYLRYSPLDIAALQYLYGPSKSARSGNDKYTISSSSANFIWDGAGTDLIDASAANQAATIYLTPGYWGYLGITKTSTITFAGQITVNFGSVIENLTGSAYADKLYGNEIANSIDGGLGNDLLEGWNGDDTLFGGIGNDSITGGVGNDSIDGGDGVDTLIVSGTSLNYTIRYNSATQKYSIEATTGTDGKDTFSNVEYISFSDKAVLLTSIDFKPPNSPIIGTEVSETFKTLTGDDSINGGGGIDTVVVSAGIDNYSVTKTATGYTLVDKNGADGTDSLINIERIQFKDKTLALDIGPGQNAGQVYRLYQAAFARTPDTPGVKYHLNDMEANGLALWNISSNFLASPEFSAKYGSNPTDTQYINALYKNVLNRTPAASEVAWYKDQFDSKKMDHQAALIGFSESPENVALVGVAISNGILLG
jgi:Ca2+-binding RTX toxin-like protein